MHCWQVASGGALAGATFIQMKYYDLTHAQRYIIDTITRLEDINKIVVKTQATAGIVFASVGVAVVVGTIALIGRIISSKKSEGKKRLYSCVVCFQFHMSQNNFAFTKIIVIVQLEAIPSYIASTTTSILNKPEVV